MKNISTANKGLKALAKENPALVENKFGYDVPGYQDGDLVDFLNADPEQRIFGIETQIRNLMLDYQDAVKNKDKDKAQRLNQEINNLDAQKIQIISQMRGSGMPDDRASLGTQNLYDLRFRESMKLKDPDLIRKEQEYIRNRADADIDFIKAAGLLNDSKDSDFFENEIEILKNVRDYADGGIAAYAEGTGPFGASGFSDFIKTMMGGSDESKTLLESGELEIMDMDVPETVEGRSSLDKGIIGLKDAEEESKEDLDDLFGEDIFGDEGEALEYGVDYGPGTDKTLSDAILENNQEQGIMSLKGSMKGPDLAKQVIAGQSIASLGASNASVIPGARRFAGGGIASIMPIEMREGGMSYNPFLDGIEDRIMFNYNDDRYGFDPRDYLKNVLGIQDVDSDFGLTDEEIAEKQAQQAMSRLARAYGASGDGISSLSMGYQDTMPGASISIDAKDVTPDVYKFYPSEVSKIYAQAKGVPFSPLVSPPKEATFIEDLQPRRIASQLYAKDGTFVDRDKLVTGPGGERGDKIPAMLSDGEFVTNAAAVRGIGLALGADPKDEYEQRLIGAREMYKMQKLGEQFANTLV